MTAEFGPENRAAVVSELPSSTDDDPVLLSKVAEMVLQRIETKLNGTDFGRSVSLYYLMAWL